MLVKGANGGLVLEIVRHNDGKVRVPGEDRARICEIILFARQQNCMPHYVAYINRTLIIPGSIINWPCILQDYLRIMFQVSGYFCSIRKCANEIPDHSLSASGCVSMLVSVHCSLSWGPNKTTWPLTQIYREELSQQQTKIAVDDEKHSTASKLGKYWADNMFHLCFIAVEYAYACDID